MKILLIVSVIIIIILIIRKYASSDSQAQDTSRPSPDKIPLDLKENDKIIIVNQVSHDDIITALTAFCNLYNKDSYAAMPRLWQLPIGSFAVTFPYDIDFTTFCFAVNFLEYPMDLPLGAQVTGWTTARATEDWITEKSAGKPVMLFLADDDKEYDNVFLTTEDNIGYKLDFASGEKLLALPKRHYQSPPVQISSLNTKSYQDFK